VDPKVEQTQQAYVYVGDDPLNGTDPSGTFNVGAAGEAESPDFQCHGGSAACYGDGLGGLMSFVKGAARRVVRGIEFAGSKVASTARWANAHSRQIDEIALTAVEAAALAACTAASEGICGAEFASFVIAAAAGATTSVARHAIAGGDQRVAAYAKEAGIGGLEGLAEEGLSDLTSLGWEPGAHETTKSFLDLVRDWTGF
jgi:hypothetical protein